MLQYLTRLYRHLDLIFWLAAKEVKVRYKMPILGFLWALLVPLLLSLILWFIFTQVLPMPSTRYPYFLFLITGIFPWMFFSQSVSGATMCILESGALIRKAAFPRAVIPFSVVAANVFNFILTLFVVSALILAHGHPFTRTLWLLPLAIFLELIFTLGITLLISGLQVRYRDVKYLTELGLLLWFYATPIFYPLSLVARGPGILEAVYRMNPFVYFAELYRLALLGEPSSALFSSAQIVALSVCVACLTFLTGFALFRRQEATFSDWVLT